MWLKEVTQVDRRSAAVGFVLEWEKNKILSVTSLTTIFSGTETQQILSTGSRQTLFAQSIPHATHLLSVCVQRNVIMAMKVSEILWSASCFDVGWDFVSFLLEGYFRTFCLFVRIPRRTRRSSWGDNRECGRNEREEFEFIYWQYCANRCIRSDDQSCFLPYEMAEASLSHYTLSFRYAAPTHHIAPHQTRRIKRNNLNDINH